MIRYLTCLFLLLAPVVLLAQTTEKELLNQLKTAVDGNAKMNIYYELGKLKVRKDAKKAQTYARNAHDIAVEKKNYGMAAQSALLMARTYVKLRKPRNVEVWSKSAQNYAMKGNDSDLIIKSVALRSSIATKARNYRRAFEINQEAFDYFSKKGTSISELEQQYEMQKIQLEKDKQTLLKDKERLAREIKGLTSQRDQLNSDKEELTERQEVLIKEKERVEEEISEKEEELEIVSEEKAEAQKLAQQKEQEVKKLSREALEKENLLMKAEIQQSRSKNLLLLLSIISGFVIILALVSYGRFRSSRKARKAIEEERQRSEELLLNILPGAIAEELKLTGKASAKKFSEATVLFTDFKNFTQIAEKMSPEMLVRELDHCFKGFDNIIAHYDNIEKIKTIGDAYMCASGLRVDKSPPNNIVQAALEMQEFLEDYKEERSRLGLPFFEARVGIHTGPVVAGVVGVNKFAYDIWGNTVNIAARMEANCDVGKVNISEATFNQVRYKFDCTPRGKIQAKNVGAIEMYFVNG